MISAVRVLALLGVAASMVAPAAASPKGVWELETRDTRFALDLCGNGTQLCGELVWLSDADYNDQYLQHLNKPMATAIQPDGENRWKGQMKLLGYSFQGTITQNSEDHMTLSGCAFLVVCKTYQMYRYSE